MSWKARFDFCGAPLVLESDSLRWIALWQRLFPEYVTQDPLPDRVFTIFIKTKQRPCLPANLPLTWKGRQPDGLEGEVFELGETLVLRVEDAVEIAIDYAEGIAMVRAKPGAGQALQGSAAMQLVDAALSHFGRVLVHAAALVHHNTGKAVLLSVKSGGGKTTTSLALARSGFDLITDDAAVIGEAEGGFRVWGLSRPLKVHRNTARLLPWIGPLPELWDENGEQPIGLGDVSDRIGVAGREPAPLSAVVEIGPRSEGASRLLPLAKPQALIALAHENVGGRPLGLTARARRRFDALGRMVAASETFELRVGSDLEELPRTISAAMSVPRT